MKLLLLFILAVLNPVFAHIGVEEGLSQTTVFSIAQTEDGNMWFATYDGLNRFDGFEVTVYRHNDNPSSIAGNSISRLLVDSEKRLWIATDGGIDIFDPATESFTHVTESRALVATDLVELENGTVLVGSSKGTFLIEKSQDGAFTSRLSPFAQRLNAVFEHLGGCVAVGGISAGISLIDLESLAETPITSLSACRDVVDITRVDNRLWVSTNGGGLYSESLRFDGDVRRYRHGAGNSLCSDHVRAVCPDGDGNLWIATGNNVSVLDTLSGIFKTISPTRYGEGSLAHCSIKSIMRSSDGGIWLGSYYGGVNYYHPARNFFNRIDVSSMPIICGGIAVCRDGSLWVGSNRHGLFHYWPETGMVRHQSLSDDPEKDDIKDITISADGRRMFVGSALGGLFVCSTSDGRVLARYGGNRGVYDSYEDENGRLWICSMSGLFYVDESSGAFKRVTFNEVNSLPAFKIIKSRDGWFWIGAVNVLMKCHLSLDENGEPEYSDLMIFDNLSFVQDIFESSSGTIWVATRAGFYSIDNNVMTRRDLAVSTNIYRGIEEDSLGRLWIMTENGLACFTPESGTMRLFTVKDGMPSNTCNTYSHAMSPDGTLYAGGISGVFSLDSHMAVSEREVMKPSLMGFSVVSGGQPKLSRNGTYVFRHAQNSFDVHYSVTDYISWQQGSFKYKMDGYDPEWRVAENSRVASYSKVKAGSYRFLVAYCPAGVEDSSEVLAVPIVVKPAWYFSTLAIIFWTLLLVSAMFGLFYSVIRRERSHSRREIERLSEKSARSERENLCLKYANTVNISDANYDFLKRSYDIVMQNISNENFAVEELSSALGLTRTRVYVRMKEITGDSALNFIRSIRLSEACRLLEEGKMSMSDIASSVGFRSAAYFSTCFKSQLGMSPKQYLSGKKS